MRLGTQGPSLILFRDARSNYHMPFTLGLVALKCLGAQMFHREPALHPSALSTPIPHFLSGSSSRTVGWTLDSPGGFWTRPMSRPMVVKHHSLRPSFFLCSQSEAGEKGKKQEPWEALAGRWQLSAPKSFLYTSTTSHQGGPYRSWRISQRERGRTPIQFQKGINVKEAPNQGVDLSASLLSRGLSGK